MGRQRHLAASALSSGLKKSLSPVLDCVSFGAELPQPIQPQHDHQVRVAELLGNEGGCVRYNPS